MAIALPRITRTAILILVAVCSQSGGQESEQPRPILPDPKLTPGDVFDVRIQDVSTPGHSKKVRAVPRALRKQAYGLFSACLKRNSMSRVEIRALIALNRSLTRLLTPP